METCLCTPQRIYVLQCLVNEAYQYITPATGGKQPVLTCELALIKQLNTLWDQIPLGTAPVKEWLEKLVATCRNERGIVDAAQLLMIHILVSHLIKKAVAYKAKNEAATAFYILTALMDVYEPVFSCINRKPASPLDTNGVVLLTVIEEGFDAIRDIEEGAHLRAVIFDYACKGFERSLQREKKYFKQNWLKMVARNANNAEEEAMVERYYTLYRNTYHDMPGARATAEASIWEIKLEACETNMSEAAFEVFLEANMEEEAVRYHAVDWALRRSDFKMAEAICRDNINTCFDADSKRSWYRVLVDIGEEAGNHNMVIEAAEWLLKENGYHDWYVLLKEHTLPGLWAEKSKEYQAYLDMEDGSFASIEVYLLEKQWDLLERSLRRMSLNGWIHKEKELAEQCPDLLEKLFDIPLWNFLKNAGIRESDTDLANYLDRARQHVGKTKVANALLLAKACYPEKKRLINTLESKLIGGSM